MVVIIYCDICLVVISVYMLILLNYYYLLKCNNKYNFFFFKVYKLVIFEYDMVCSLCFNCGNYKLFFIVWIYINYFVNNSDM